MSPTSAFPRSCPKLDQSWDRQHGCATRCRFGKHGTDITNIRAGQYMVTPNGHAKFSARRQGRYPDSSDNQPRHDRGRWCGNHLTVYGGARPTRPSASNWVKRRSSDLPLGLSLAHASPGCDRPWGPSQPLPPILRTSTRCTEALPRGRGRPVGLPGGAPEDGGEGAPGLIEDGGPVGQGDVTPTNAQYMAMDARRSRSRRWSSGRATDNRSQGN
jgi:hypothetical protein